MRIVMIGPFAWAPKGTVSARAFLIGQALVERGHQVTILMPPYDNPSQAGYRSTRDGVHLFNLSMPSWGDSAWARFTVPIRMAHQVVQFSPDLVHVFKPIGYSGLVGMHLRVLRSRVPLVLDCDDWEGRGGWADVNPYPRPWRWFLAWQESWLTRRADVVTVASRTLESRVWGLGLPRERVFYLPNGPDRGFQAQRDVSAEKIQNLRQALGVGNAPLALYIGHISYGSEVGLIVEALPMVVEAAPELRIVIIGSGDGLLHLQEQTRRAGLYERVIFTGWVDPAQTPVYLAAADVALYPHRDTLVNRAKSPSKIMAYMAMGKPVVASAVGEAVAYLDGGRAGLLVDPNDACAFAECMIRLLRDRPYATELGRRAERRVIEVYDWTRQVLKVEKAYRAALAAQGME